MARNSTIWRPGKRWQRARHALGAQARRRYARDVSGDLLRVREPRRRLIGPVRTACCALAILALAGASAAPAALAAAAPTSSNNSFNELVQKAQQTTPTTSTATSSTSSSSESSTSNSKALVFGALGLAIVLLIGIGYVIARDARKIAPEGELHGGESAFTRDPAVRLRKRRARAKAARRQRKRNR